MTKPTRAGMCTRKSTENPEFGVSHSSHLLLLHALLRRPSIKQARRRKNDSNAFLPMKNKAIVLYIT